MSKKVQLLIIIALLSVLGAELVYAARTFWPLSKSNEPKPTTTPTETIKTVTEEPVKTPTPSPAPTTPTQATQTTTKKAPTPTKFTASAANCAKTSRPYFIPGGNVCLAKTEYDAILALRNVPTVSELINR